MANEHSDDNRDNDRLRMTPRTDRYSALPDETRKFIENLHDDDLENWAGLLRLVREKTLPKIVNAIDVAEGVSLLGRWSKWGVITATAMFMGIAGLITAWGTVRDWLKGVH